jgi:hypothetical protein
MSKFNRSAQPLSAASRATSPLSTVVTPQLSSTLVRPDITTHEGGDGFTRTPRTELFLMCTSSFITEDSFYETGDDRVQRVRELVRTVTLEEGGLEWLLDFVTWLRGPEANIRTAAIVVAAETVRARRSAHPGGQINLERDWIGNGAAGGASGRPETLRCIVAAALQRADEPGEMLAYWTSRYGKPIPNSLKRGIADAATRLYTEYSTLKYDTGKASVRFGDVVALCRPQPPADKAVLFRHLIERRHPNWKDGSGQELGKRGVPDTLAMFQVRRKLEDISKPARRELLKRPLALQEMLKDAGATWEYVAGWLSDGQGMDRYAWEAVIPQMGYMALLRNLRNFDEAGVSDEVAATVAAKLADPEQVARSRQFPFRFLSAYEAAPSDRWKVAIGTAIGHSMRNLPELNGSTLVMVDTSASMDSRLSGKSQRTYVELAALFGIALTYRNVGKVGLYMFADRAAKYEVTRGGSVLAEVAKFRARIGQVGHGTQIEASTMQAFGTGYDRIIIISDMQSFGGRGYTGSLSGRIPARVPIYAFDLSSYKAGVMPAGGAARFQLGGLSDATFRMIPQVEAGLTGNWPWVK